MGSYDKVSGRYTDALGSIQDGESDILGMLVYYPLNDPDDKYFDYSSPIFEDRIMMVSAFNPKVEPRSTNLLSMFTSVPIDLWWGTLIGFLTFVLTLNLGYRVLGVSKK